MEGGLEGASERASGESLGRVLGGNPSGTFGTTLRLPATVLPQEHNVVGRARPDAVLFPGYKKNASTIVF